MKIEKQLLSSVDKNKKLLYLAIITVLGLLIRISSFDFISDDMSTCLIPWFNQIKANGGFRGLSVETGNYTLLYQTLIAIMGYININCVYQYKILSCIFDFVLAVSCGYMVCDFKGVKIKNSPIFDLVYTAVLIIPVFFLNSTFWGQCDAIYASFCLWSLYFFYKGKYRKGFIFFGIAFAFKLQAIFIVPIILYWYFVKKEFSLLGFVYSFVVFYFSGIVAFINGRELIAPLFIYFGQTVTYNSLSMNYPSFWLIIGSDYDSLTTIALLSALVILGLGLYVVMNNLKKMDTPEEFINTCCWVIWTVVLFMPKMHERYGFLLDVLLIILCFINKKYIVFTVIDLLLTMTTYGYFLYYSGTATATMSVINTINWLLFTCLILSNKKIKDYLLQAS